MRFTRAIGFLSLFFTLHAAAQNQPQKPPCSQPEVKQLDFWVGEWDLTWPAQQGQPAGKGTNVVTRELDGCVVEENFNGANSGGLIGRSVSVYNAHTGKWHQTWVDNQGSYIDLAGGWDGKQFHLEREFTNPKGQKILQRMIFKNITPNSFDWTWESSSDEGKTWQVQWPIHYERKKG